jgi:hypothetical protein
MVSEFACNSNFSVAELIKDINVTPPPTNAPTLTLTQTAAPSSSAASQTPAPTSAG